MTPATQVACSFSKKNGESGRCLLKSIKQVISIQFLCLFLIICLVSGGCTFDKRTVSQSGSTGPSQSGNANPSEEATPDTAEPTPAAIVSQSPLVSESPFGNGPGTDGADVDTPSSTTIRTDYPAFSPNELGRIPVVMFHKFVDAFEPKTEKNYTTTYAMFETLLETLYEKGFRLISMQDFLSGRISVPAGTRPIVFTFDDGTASQYSLDDANGMLQVKPATAVGVMQRFQKIHPDFGLKGIFFLTMDAGNNTFPGKGILKERISLLRDLGFEVGSHTWGHVDFTEKGAREDVETALGLNQKAITEIMPDIVFHALALPYGGRPKDKSIRPYLAEGSWKGTPYRNEGVFAVGSGPSVTVFDKRFDPLYISRVRATGKIPAEADLDWWLAEAGSKTFYVSDGNPDTLVIPEGGDVYLNPENIGELRIIRYVPTP